MYSGVLHEDIRCASRMAICLSGRSLLPCSAFSSQRPHSCLAVISCLFPSKYMWAYTSILLIFIHLKNTSPLRNQLKPLIKIDPIKHSVDSRLGFVLHTITGFHRPSLTHYYGFICHLTPTLNLGFPLEFRPLIYSKFRCQASPVTALAPC